MLMAFLELVLKCNHDMPLILQLVLLFLDAFPSFYYIYITMYYVKG